MFVIKVVERVADRLERIVPTGWRGVIVRLALRLRLLTEGSQRAAMLAIAMHAHEMTWSLFPDPGRQPRLRGGSRPAVAFEPLPYVPPVVHLLKDGRHPFNISARTSCPALQNLRTAVLSSGMSCRLTLSG
ncbi:hypothetical protein B0G71_8194 [Paraburkholderia sp. BL27I4N3]|uniref:hypothetical protein n=1 Tax=Paraburkholderia sp. BL27I4N3 TaxID=1938805 RepID=UPI000E27675B|nr:hypothetical protein [Paraburkholderia sp. BL27I4N3]REE06516.1 hypothetical protein B0G71_8194 [Paraburkholderia sp. BL27I4N3]